jgi:acyl-CoA reductase-like NAD-dependent aldehyde dehydrogenase
LWTIDLGVVGQVTDADAATVRAAMAAAEAGFPNWTNTPVERRRKFWSARPSC